MIPSGCGTELSSLEEVAVPCKLTGVGCAHQRGAQCVADARIHSARREAGPASPPATGNHGSERAGASIQSGCDAVESIAGAVLGGKTQRGARRRECSSVNLPRDFDVARELVT
jgi:hypothetical protein